MKAFHHPLVEVEGYEADDVIGTLAEYWRAQGHPICVVTADKDLAQLVREDDHWWDFSRNMKLNTGQLTEKFGVLPEQMADYLALTGDAVDNIPGVPGIGPKSASALLREFGDLDSLFERVDEVAGMKIRGAKSIHRKLIDHRDAADLEAPVAEQWTRADERARRELLEALPVDVVERLV